MQKKTLSLLSCIIITFSATNGVINARAENDYTFDSGHSAPSKTENILSCSSVENLATRTKNTYVLDNGRIAAHEAKIKTMLTTHRTVENLVLVAGAASTALFLYQTFFAPASAATAFIPQSLAVSAPRIPWSQAPVELIKNIFSYKTAFRLAGIAEHMLVAQLLQTLCSKTHHPHTIQWFVLQHLDLQKTTKALRLDLKALSLSTMVEGVCQNSSPYIEPLLKALIDKSEQIAAFINIQKPNIAPNNQMYAAQSAHDFFKNANQFFAHFHRHEDTITPHEATLLIKALDTFEQEIMRLMQIHAALQEI